MLRSSATLARFPLKSSKKKSSMAVAAHRQRHRRRDWQRDGDGLAEEVSTALIGLHEPPSSSTGGRGEGAPPTSGRSLCHPSKSRIHFGLGARGLSRVCRPIASESILLVERDVAHLLGANPARPLLLLRFELCLELRTSCSICRRGSPIKRCFNAFGFGIENRCSAGGATSQSPAVDAALDERERPVSTVGRPIGRCHAGLRSARRTPCLALEVGRSCNFSGTSRKSQGGDGRQHVVKSS